MVPSILGFDPRYQFIHEDDIVGVLEHAVRHDLPGIYNAAADGVLVLSEVAGLLGKPLAPLLPPWGTGLAAVPLKRLGLNLSPEMLNQLRFGRGLDNRKLKAAGAPLRHTTRETVQAFAEHLRIAAIKQRRGRAVPLRAGSGGVPALQPERAAGGRAGLRVLLADRQRNCRTSSGYHSRPTILLHVRSRSFFIVAAVLVLLLVAAGGVYAYDSGRKDQIAKGIKVGGVDVGGLKARAAQQRLRAAVLEKLNRPVVAKYHGKHFTLTPKQARVGVDIDGSVAQALHRSRSGNIFARTSRNLRGTSLNEDLNLDISYNRAAIRRMVKRISARIDKPARDAAVNLEQGNVDPTPSADGLAVRAASLRSQAAALAALDRRRAQRARAHEGRQAQGHDRPARQEVSGRRDRQPRRLQAHALQEPQARQDLRDRGRPGRPRDTRPGSTTCRTRRSTPPGRCPTRPGWRPATAAR